RHANDAKSHHSVRCLWFPGNLFRPVDVRKGPRVDGLRRQLARASCQGASALPAALHEARWRATTQFRHRKREIAPPARRNIAPRIKTNAKSVRSLIGARPKAGDLYRAGSPSLGRSFLALLYACKQIMPDGARRGLA